MDNKTYWQQRFEELASEQMQKALDMTDSLKEVYIYTLEKLKAEVVSWYVRYAKENNISLADARKALDSRELKAFKLTLKEYLNLAKQNNLPQEYQELLKKSSIRARLNRSQVLYIKIVHFIEQLANQQQIDLTQLLQEIYEDSYYKTAYETQLIKGAFTTFAEVPKATINNAISKPWAQDGKIFSERIWLDRTKLVNSLQSEITRTFMAHEGTTVLTNRIAKRFDVSFNNAKRLIETETAYVQETARMDSLTKLGVKKYQLLATLDRKTSAICRDMDKKVFDVKDAVVGINKPPLHCYCRTTTIPYIKGITDEDSSRIARNDNKKSYHVDGNMKYEDWKKVFVDKTMSYKSWQVRQKKGIIRVEKVKLFAKPNSITERVSNKGGIEWNFYDKKGRQYKQISNNDHGNPKQHPYGKHGEHAHDYIYDKNGKPIRNTRELTAEERKEVEDIL